MQRDDGFLERLFGRLIKGRRRKSGNVAKLRNRRLLIEPLEKRQLFSATTLYWHPVTGSTAWDTSTSNWSTQSDGGGTPTTWSNGDNAVFWSTTANTAAISGTVQAAQITFETSCTISGSSLSLSSGSTIQVTAWNLNANISAPITISTGDVLTVDGPGLLTVSALTVSGGWLYNYGAISSTTLTVSSGWMINFGSLVSHGTTTNYGTLNSYGTLTNKGTLDNYGGLNNSGTLDNYSGYTLNNFSGGMLTNYGTVTNNGTANNNGTLESLRGGALDSSDVLVNNGTLTIDAGSALSNSGWLDNFGWLDNYGTASNSGGLENFCGSTLDSSGALTNNGTLTIDAGSALSNNGTFANNGMLANNGTLNNNGTLGNGGTLNNGSYCSSYCGGYCGYCGGYCGDSSSEAVLNNNGTLDNYSGSVLNLYSGTMNNFCGATLDNFSGASLGFCSGGELINGGTATNEGTLSPTVTVSSSASTVGEGSKAMLTALIDGGSDGLSARKVEFFDNGALLGTAKVIDGIAVFETNSLVLGENTIGAAADGDYAFMATTSVNVVNVASPVLMSPASTIAASSTVTVTATMPAGATGSGSAAGSVQFYVNGTAQGSAVTLQTMTPALQFGVGSTSYISVASPVGLPTGNEARTISTWFKLGSMATNMEEIVGYGSASSAGQLFGIAAGKVGSSGTIQVNIDGATTSIPWSEDENWHELDVVLPAGGTLGSVSIYLDGTQHTATPSSSSAAVNTAAGPLTIGGSSGTGWANPFSGSIGETLIFARAFTAANVAALVANPGTYYEDRRLVLGYLFNEGSGTTLNDISGYGNNASLPSSGVIWSASGGPSSIAATASVSFSESSSGSYTIKAVYSTSGSGYASGTSGELVENVVSPPASAPVILDGTGTAVTGTTGSGTVGTDISLSVQNPNDFDTYTWNVTAGGSPYASGEGTSFDFIPDSGASSTGTAYAVTVTDSNPAGSSSASCSFNVTPTTANPNPSLSISGMPSSGLPEGSALLLAASMANPATSYSYLWSVTQGSSSAPVASGIGRTFDYTPQSSGSFIFHLAAKDAYGQSLSSSASATVDGVPPSGIFSVGQPSVSGSTETFAVSLGHAYDPSAPQMSSGFQYAFSSVAGSSAPTSYGSWGASSTSSFSFSSPGVYTIGGRVKDAEGAFSTYQETVVVGDPTLTPVSPSGPPTTGPSTGVTLSGGDRPVVSTITFTPHGTGDVGWHGGQRRDERATSRRSAPDRYVGNQRRDLRLTIGYSHEHASGDSSSISYAWSYVALSGGATTITWSDDTTSTSAAPTAAFGSAGNYRITLTVTDGSGLTATGTFDVTVVQKLTNIKVSSLDSAPVSLPAGGTELFFAECMDQFGNDMVTPPPVTWSAHNG